MSWPFVTIRSILLDLVSDLLPTRAVIQSVLLCAFFLVTSTHTSFRPTSQYRRHSFAVPNLLAVISFLVTCRCVPVHASFLSIFAAWPGLVPATLLPSTPHTRALLPSLPASEAYVSRPAGRPLLTSTATCPSNSKVCHRGQIHGSRTRRLLQVLSLVSKSALRRPVSSRPSASLFTIFPTTHPPPRRAWPWSRVPPQPWKRESETDSFLPAAAATCLLNFSPSVGEIPTACPLHSLAGIKPILSSFLVPIFM